VVTVAAGVIIVTGPPGSGKSTVAALHARTYRHAVHLHTDDFWHYIVAGLIPPYEPASETQNQTVVDVIAGAAYTYARGGFTTIVDGVVGPWMLGHYFAQARQHPEVALTYVVLRAGRDETLARAQGRTAPAALVDEQPIRQLWEQFADLGPYERHALDTSGESAEASAQRVADAVASTTHRLRSGT
jgi:broad-specificity NMP kinase